MRLNGWPGPEDMLSFGYLFLIRGFGAHPSGRLRRSRRDAAQYTSKEK
jgi:hypothetical protein